MEKTALQSTDRPADDRSRWWKGALTGALGLLFCYRGVLLFFEPEASQRARAMSIGILLVLLAIQYFSGAPRSSRQWLWWAVFLIPGVDIALTSWETASPTGDARQFVFVFSSLVVPLLILALWVSIRRRRRAEMRNLI
jgi:uncharacterized membrane protein HdeD (DUF308 family)